MTKPDPESWAPRPDDHLVEPFFGAIDQGGAAPSDHQRELDPFGEQEGPPSSLQRGAIPPWWIWISLVAGAGALWVLLG